MRSASGSGSFVVVTMPSISKVTAPNQMPNAIARPPTMVSPGYFTSMREPSLRSSEIPLHMAVPRPSRSASVCCCTPPKVTSARRRASSRSSFCSRTSRSVSISIWKRISLSILDSAERRERRRNRAFAAWNQVMRCSVNGSSFCSQCLGGLHAQRADCRGHAGKHAHPHHEDRVTDQGGEVHDGQALLGYCAEVIRALHG